MKDLDPYQKIMKENGEEMPTEARRYNTIKTRLFSTTLGSKHKNGSRQKMAIEGGYKEKQVIFKKEGRNKDGYATTIEGAIQFSKSQSNDVGFWLRESYILKAISKR